MKSPFTSISQLIRANDKNGLEKALQSLSPFEISTILSNRRKKEQELLFSLLPPKISIETFEYIPVSAQKNILPSLSDEKIASILTEMKPDDRTALLEALPSKAFNSYLNLLPNTEKQEAQNLLGYPKNSVGRLMTPDFIEIKPEWTVEKVLDHLRAYGHDSETINVLYVVNDQDVLIDDVKLKDFLFAPKNTKVSQLGDKQFVSLSTLDNYEHAIAVFKEYGRIALPVLDEKGRMRGIVTIDDILRLASERGTANVQEIGGTEPLEGPYMSIPFLNLIDKRAKWLVLLFLGEMFTATAMAYFEDEISKAVVLALFLPLIISSGGNAGSQSSTLIIRALALGEVKLKNWWQIFRREIYSGLVLGIILGVVGFARVSLWSSVSTIYGPHWVLVAFTIFFSLIAVVLWGSLAGSMLPLILRRFGFDPAVASAPLVATIVDVSGIVMYFGIAMIILKGTLL